MTQLLKLSELPADVVRWTSADGVAMLTVVAKATFDLAQGQLGLSQEQLPLYATDIFYGEDAYASVYAPADLIPFKLSPEVLLVGKAYVASGRTARTVKARLRVGGVDKTLQVLVDRTMEASGQIREHERFSSMPIRYERSARGPQGQNPVGTVIGQQHGVQGGDKLPNVIPVGAEGTQNNQLAAVGFGPLGAGWPEREAGDLDPRGLPDSWQNVQLDKRLNARFFNSAPRDQWLDSLQDSDIVLLENLHREHARLRFGLSPLRPRVFLDPLGRELPMRLDTLWIDTERECCTLTWRAQVAQSQVESNQRLLVGAEAGSKPLDWAALRAIASGQRPQPDLRTAAVSPSTSEQTAVGIPAQRAAVPFAAAASDGASALRWETTDSSVEAVDGAALSATPAWLNLSSSGTTPSSPGRKLRPSSFSTQELQATARNRGATLPNPAEMEGFKAFEMAIAPVTGTVAPGEPSDATTAEQHQPGSPWAQAKSTAQVNQEAHAGPVALEQTRAAALPPSPAQRPAHVIRPNPLAGDSRPAVVMNPVPIPNTKEEPSQPKFPDSRERIALLWLEGSHAKDWKSVAAWAELVESDLAAQEPEEIGFDDEVPPPETEEEEAARIARVVLASARPFHAEEAGLLLSEAVGTASGFAAPWVMLSGRLRCRFSPKAALEATATLVELAPSPGAQLEACAKRARHLLAQRGVEFAHEALRAMTAELEQLSPSPVQELRSSVERLLVRQRAFLNAEVFGTQCVCAEFRSGEEDGSPAVAYLPEEAAAALPLYASVPVRLLCQLHPRQSQDEAAGEAFFIAAVARILAAH